MKTNEFRKMMGDRHMDSDGFTYIYGAIKNGSSNRAATARTRQRVRNDKRAVKACELRQVFKDLE
jgi:hypothetical protein